MRAPQPTGFLGLSHLGVVGSIGYASLGQPVIAVDLDAAPVEMLSRGDVPVHEPSLDELFAMARERMVFSTDLARLESCPLVIVARDIPTDSTGASDSSRVLELVDAALPHLCHGVTLVLMSQVAPSFTRRLAERIRTSRPELRFTLYYWVETLIFGRAVERYLRPERIIIGCEDSLAPLPDVLQAALDRFGSPVLRMSYESAELTKMAINLYLSATVTYANTLSDVCEAIGADWSEMMPALRLDSRIGPAAYIRPGLGIAGGNLERDLVTLREVCRAHRLDPVFIETLLNYNERRHAWVHRRLSEHLFSRTTNPVVAVWGLAYKKNTRSTKNSIALRVINDLRGLAEIRAYDPALGPGDVDVPAKVVSDRDEALIDADCLLVLTDWDEFARPNREAMRRMRRPLVIDCVGVVDIARVELAGVHYVSMGRSPKLLPAMAGPAGPR